jgi:hypothetical protein
VVTDLRQQIAEAVHFAHAAHYGCAHCTRTAEAVMAVLQPVLDAKDAEIARLRVAWQSAQQGRRSARLLSGEFQRIIRKQRQRAEQAEKREAEIREDRDQMWAEVQKLRETVLALAQPGDQEGTQ